MKRSTVRALGSALATYLAAIGTAEADTFHEGEVITSPTTWGAADNDHIVIGWVTVEPGASLTIEDGCVVRFDQASGLQIKGSLSASGADLTRRDPNDAWWGIRFQAGSDGTLSACTIEHASLGSAAVQIQSADVAITGCTLRNSSYGIRVLGGAPPVVSGCTIENNGTGIVYDGVASPALTDVNTLENNAIGVLFDDCSAPSIEQQLISGSSGTGAIVVRESGAFTIGSANVVTGNAWGLTIDIDSWPSAASAGHIPLAGNANDDGIRVDGGMTSRDATWRDVGADYIVTANPTVTAAGTLTIESGCTVRFEHQRLLQNNGTLDALGGAQGILLTRRDPGDQWFGVRYGPGSAGTLQACTLEHASLAGTGAVQVDDAANVALDGCTIRHNLYGLYALRGSGPTITGCTFESNTVGLVYQDVTAPALTAPNTFESNETAILANGCASPLIESQTIAGSNGDEGAISVRASGELTLGPGNVITGNRWALTIDMDSWPSLASAGNVPLAGNTNAGIQVRGGSTARSAVWHDLGADYVVTENAVVAGAGMLTVESGCTVRFQHQRLLMVDGGMHASGGAPGILFTRHPEATTWWGIRFRDGAIAELRDCTIEHVDDTSAIRALSGADVSIDDCTIRHSNTGVSVTDADVRMAGCTIEDNDFGVVYITVDDISFTEPNVFQNNDTGILFDRSTGVVVDRQTITGSTSSGVLVLDCGDFHVGPDNDVTGNAWGLSINTGSGPDAASAGHLPLAGNVNDDAIQVLSSSGNRSATWRDFGVPYRVTVTTTIAASGSLTIEDGVDVLADGDVTLYVQGTLAATGETEGIAFRATDDLAGWNGLRFRFGGTGTLTGCTIRDATHFTMWSSGVFVDTGSSVDLVACTISGNGRGVSTWDAGSVSFVNCVITQNTGYGIYLNHASAATFGSDPSDWNDVYGNGDGTPGRDLRNGTLDIQAAYVHWGVVDEAAIEARIEHEPDDGALGRVTFLPWTDASHTTVYGAQFVNVTPGAMLQPESASGGAWGDYDGDGDHDLFVSGHGDNKLFRNDGGTFVDATPDDIPTDRDIQQAVWLDIDDDGRLDLLLAAFDGLALRILNLGGDEWSWAGFGHAAGHWGASFADVDADRDLDLLLLPQGGPAGVWENSGTGWSAPDTTFAVDQPLDAAWGDFDDDGDADLVIAGASAGLPTFELYTNDQGVFELDRALMPNESFTFSTVAWCDANNDGHQDLHTGAYAFDDRLYCNEGGGVFDVFDPCAAALADTGRAQSGAWGDYDNDGFADLYLTNEESPNRLFRNLGDGNFADVAVGVLASPGVSDDSGAAWADYDGDGDLDLFVAGFGGDNRLLRNDTVNTNHWFHVDLIGQASNRQGWGAKLTVYAGGAARVHEVSSGSGARAQNSVTAEFGLGTATLVDSVVVRWPSGITDTFGPFAANQRVSLTEEVLFSDAHIHLLPIDDARGISWADVDGDHDDDFYVSRGAGGTGGANVVFLNVDGGANFSGVSLPPLDESDATCSAWGDYDDDGLPDVLVVRQNGDPVLFHNDGDRQFTDVTPPELAGHGRRGASWIDYDLDGDLDLYLVGTLAEPALLMNVGAGSFVDVTAGALTETIDETQAAWGDFDGDGDLDLYSCRRFGEPNRLLRNDGGLFADVTAGEMPADVTGSVAAWGDYDNDEDLDLYVGDQVGTARLLRNDGANGFGDVTTSTLAGSRGVRSVSWCDFDNDADLDLWSTPLTGQPRLLRNDGGSFTDVAGRVAPRFDGSVEAAWSDYDADGDLDVVMVTYLAGLRLLENLAGDENHWIAFRFVGDASNRAGIGVRARIVAGGVSQIRELVPGAGRRSQHSTRMVVGLGAATAIDLVEIRWPSGMVQTLTSAELPSVDALYLVGEEGTVVGADDVPGAPAEFALGPAVPNPFSASSRIDFSLPHPSAVDLRIFDVGGRLVRVLAEGRLEAGTHAVRWDGRDGAGRTVAPGVYFYHLGAGDAAGSRRIVRTR